MDTLFLVGLGGGLGAVARYGIGALVSAHYVNLKFPLATFAVNFMGCLLIGLLAGLAAKHQLLGPGVKLFLITGFLGGFTTFSAFGFETFFLARRGDLVVAGLNIAASLVCCLAAVWFGAKLGGFGGVDN